MYSLSDYFLFTEDNYLFLADNKSNNIYYAKMEVPYHHFDDTYGPWFKYYNYEDKMEHFLIIKFDENSIHICEKDFGFGPEFGILVTTKHDELFLPMNKK